ncbi:hypothetical protein GUITHDRAFT_113436 [Guillardia theta CCMP2712]|uniref:IPT/TIG domain-containing protein n=1 Tax=Guillardia theta (strain CCMP2712) TaxID=905079 RepID=L1IWE0_GUITC|nr:hypothetical protein GUITHDRAFT_113436 [Guillardia theta CCMP2712]EKX40407.1 hypothetical protein GUITHDRAFT_113436 [Guillardia theta CCMP2712]|eukprot:XP_005827387.1 hypothetical protein GUITHDRAFT_113436 [Guillardia theta CCMP2712]
MENEIHSGNAEFLFVRPPTITNLTPSFCKLQQKTQIQVYGTDFREDSMWCRVGTQVTAARTASSTLLHCIASATREEPKVYVEVSLNGVDFTQDEKVLSFYEAPEVHRIEPSCGPESGETPVTLIGRGFEADAGVGCRFGEGSEPSRGRWIAANMISCTTPRHDAGNATLSLQVLGSWFSTGTSFLFLRGFAVSHLKPRRLFSHQTGSITVFGRGFDYKSEYWCDFRHDEAHPQLAVWLTSTKLACLSPSQTPGEKLLYVSQDGGAMTSELVLEVIAAPEITDVVPSLGVTSVPTRLEVVGSGFQDGFLCCMGTTVLPSSVVSDSKIECTIPATAVPEDLTIGIGMEDTECTEHPSGQVRIMEACSLVSALPDVGSSSGRNESVILTGKGFVKEQDRECWFGAAKSTSLWLSSSLVTCELPPHPAGSVVISLSMQGVKYCESSFNFTYLGEASVQAIRPSAVYETGGTEVTLSGHFMHRVTFELLVGDHAMSCQVQDSDQATCVTPPKLKGVYRLRPSAHSMEINPACVVRYVGLPSVSSIHPTSGPSQGGTRLLLEGEDFEAEMLLCAFARVRVWAEVRSSTVCECVAPASSEGGGRTSLRLVIRDVDYIVGEQSYIYYEPPRIDEIKPSAARVGQEEKITILGRNLDRECGITLGSQRAEVSEYVSSTMVVVLVPGRARSAWQGNMTVGISRNGVDWDTHGFGYEWTSGFVVMRIEPSVGGVDGGDWIRVEGYGYAKEVVNINFGDRQARCNVTSEWEVSCLSPRGEAGQVSVYGEGSRETEGAWFVYHQRVRVEKIWPTSGSALVRTQVTLTFKHLKDVTWISCKVQNSAITTLIISSSSIVCEIPAQQAQQLSISIFESNFFITSFPFKLFDSSTFFQVKPSTFLANQASIMTIFGSNFQEEDWTKCIFGMNRTFHALFLTSSMLQCTVPALSVGNYSVVFKNSYLSVLNSSAIIIERPVKVRHVLPSFGPISEAFIVRVVGDGFSAEKSYQCLVGESKTAAKWISAEMLSCSVPPRNQPAKVPFLVAASSEGFYVPGMLTFVYQDPFALWRVEPSLGSMQGGILVTVVGGFNLQVKGVTCSFGSRRSLSSTLVSSSELICQVPAWPRAVEVTTIHLLAQDVPISTKNLSFQYFPVPQLQSADPSASVAGCSVVFTVHGKNFAFTNRILCKVGEEVLSAVLNKDDEIICNGTLYAIGNQSLSISNNAVEYAESNLTFLVHSEIKISHVLPSYLWMDERINITVYLESSMIDADSVCVIDGQISGIHIISSQAITCLSPRVNHTEIEVYLQVLRTQVKSNSFKLAVMPRITILALSPSLGAVTGGTRISITGNNFTVGPSLQCQFGSIRVPGIAVSSTRITCTSPGSALPIESKVQVVDYIGRYASNDLEFIFHKVVEVHRVFPIFLSAQMDQTFTIFGSNFLSELYFSFEYSSVLKGVVLSDKLAVCNVTFTEGQSELLISTNKQDWSQTGFTISFAQPFKIYSIRPSLGYPHEYFMVTIFGENFNVNNSYTCFVQRIDTAAMMISSSMLLCPLIYDRSANQIQISVSSVNQTSIGNELFYQIQSSPRIFSFVPSKAPVRLNTPITVQGEQFVDSETILCKIDDSESPGYFVSTSLIICIARRNSPGMFTLTIDFNVSSTSDSPIFVFEDAAHSYNYSQDSLKHFRDRYSSLLSVRISGVFPTMGSTEGGQTLTIAGSFTRSDSLVVFFDDFKANLDFVSSTAMSCRNPKHREGLVSIRVSFDNFEPTRKIGTFRYLQVCQMQLLSQQNVFAEKAHEIFVFGKFFDDSTVFKVSEQQVMSEMVSSTMASLHVPPLSYGMVLISCSTASLDSNIKLPVYVRTPLKILKISPTQAFIGEPIQVRMLLDYLPYEDTFHCQWGTTRCRFIKEDVHLATCACPLASAPGSYEISITSWDFHLISSSVAQFKYDKSRFLAEPSKSSTTGGQVVTISGLLPLGLLYCKFDQNVALALRLTASQMSCQTPSHAPALVKLAVLSGDTILSSVPFLYLSDQFVISLLPSLGPSQGQTPISVIGSLFNPDIHYSCVFTSQRDSDLITSSEASNHVAAYPQTSTLIVCNSPPHQTQAVFVYLSGSERVIQQDNMFIFYDAEISSLRPTLVKEHGGTRISVQGGDFPEALSLMCKFSDTLVSATWISISMLVCDSPALSEGSKQLFVTINGLDFISASSQIATFKDPTLLACSLTTFADGSASVAVVGRFFTESMFCKLGEYVSTLSEFVSSSSVLCGLPAAVIGDRANASLQLSGNGVDFSSGCPLKLNATSNNESWQHRWLLSMDTKGTVGTPSVQDFRRLISDVFKYEQQQDECQESPTRLSLMFDLVNPLTGNDSAVLCDPFSASLMTANPPVSLHLALANVRAVDSISQTPCASVQLSQEQVAVTGALSVSSQKWISAVNSDVEHGEVSFWMAQSAHQVEQRNGTI